jgi:hypothetical protein
MRAAVVLIVVFLIVGAAAIALWPVPIPFEPAVPGQYNLRESRPTWPSSERVVPYRPGPGMGSNRLI